jgi:hypothetical protein
MPVSVGADAIANARSPSSDPVGLVVVSNPSPFGGVLMQCRRYRAYRFAKYVRRAALIQPLSDQRSRGVPRR